LKHYTPFLVFNQYLVTSVCAILIVIMSKKTEALKTDLEIPETLAIIMDGNRRYATSLGLPKEKGHALGYKKLIQVAEWTRKLGIKNLVVYAFSTENWQRSEKEVSALLTLLQKALLAKNLKRKDTRLKIIGDTSSFSKPFQKAIALAEKETKNNGPFTLVVALSYGGQNEILQAVNSLLEKKVDTVTKEVFQAELWAGEFVPDMCIRTGGEKRLSNFLLWQLAYSELFFTDTAWPALTEEEFASIIVEYSHRKRNFGK
jgi:undecaprenyl diphosphate synthase